QIVVTQGERPMSADNKSLGRFILDGIPPSPRGVPQIEVTFDMDASGILKVTAKDKATEKTQHITISGAVGLSDDEVKRMQEEAEHHKAEDQKKAEKITAKNQADSMVAAAEKALKDAGDKAPADVKTKVEEKIKAVKDVLAKEDASKEDIDSASKELSDTLSQIGQSMYGNQTQNSNVKSQNEESKEGEEKKEETDNGQEKKSSKGKDGKAKSSESAERVEEGEVVE
ncbi:MAG: Chaperone protein DnaK, partial [Microgenomates group bacterium GW2011_GWF1_38_5]